MSVKALARMFREPQHDTQCTKESDVRSNEDEINQQTNFND